MSEPEFFVVSGNGTPAPFSVQTHTQGFYTLHFRPPLASVADWRLYVRANKALAFETALAPPLFVEPIKVDFLDQTYVVYETHALGQLENGRTRALYLELDQGRASVNMGLYWMRARTGVRFTDGAPFFPFDLDTRAIPRLDTRVIPQRTPAWLKLRDEVTGTKAYKLLGFWVPTPSEDPRWSYDAPERYTERQLQNMRLGTLSEDYAALMYLAHYPDRRIDTVGWCKSSRIGWGASPDGLVLAPEDGERGVLEIKTTASQSLAMAAYYYPQVYLEMFSTESTWCDLVRYSQQTTSRGELVHRARIYRVYRDPALEEGMFRLIQHSLANKQRLQALVHEKNSHYTQLRQHLSELASALPYAEVRVDEALNQLLREYAEYKRELERPGDLPSAFELRRAPEQAPVPRGGRGPLPWVAETGARQHQIAQAQAAGNHERVRLLIAQQIEAHTRVLAIDIHEL